MRKETRKYYFSVEGETEKWYLDWLQKTINAIPESKYNVKLDAKIQKDPLARVKRINGDGLRGAGRHHQPVEAGEGPAGHRQGGEGPRDGLSAVPPVP